MDAMAVFDAQGRTVRRPRSAGEILADIPPDVLEARRVLRAGGDPGPMPPDRLVFIGSERQKQLARPGEYQIAPADFDIDRPGDLAKAGNSLLLGNQPAVASKILTRHGEMYVPESLALTPQAAWKSHSGIQVITGDHGPDCCCSRCCCPEPAEAPTAYYTTVRPDCPCNTKEERTIGVFLDGIEKGDPKLYAQGSIMSYLCKRYKGETLYRLGTADPLATDEIVQQVVKSLKYAACWMVGSDPPSSGFLKECAPLTIDLFGFSRGGLMTMMVADHLNKEFECERCQLSYTFPKLNIRFLGVVDPNYYFFSGYESVPTNVRHVWTANSKESSSPLTAEFYSTRIKDTPGREGTFKDAGRYSLEHGEMGDATKGPTGDLMDYYNKMSFPTQFATDEDEVKELLKSHPEKAYCGGGRYK